MAISHQFYGVEPRDLAIRREKIRKFSATGSADQGYPNAVYLSDSLQRYAIVWEDNRNGNWDIYGSRFAPLRAGFSATPAVGTAPLQVAFSDESTPADVADEWRWSFGDGLTSTLAAPGHTYTETGVYTVTQWVTDTDTGETNVLTRTCYITVEPPLVITYDYDPLYRLVTATYSTGDVYTYTYDEVGNRKKKGVNGTVTGYEYDDGFSKQITRVTWPNSVPFGVDRHWHYGQRFAGPRLASKSASIVPPNTC